MQSNVLLALPPDVVEDYRNSLVTKYVGVASFSFLIWDHAVTFSDEKGPARIPLSSESVSYTPELYREPMGILSHHLDPRIVSTSHVCKHFVRYEGSMTMIGISVVALMMFVRVHALYTRMFAVQALALSILLAYIGTNAWLLTHGAPVQHKSPLVESCTMIFTGVGWAASASAWLPLLYDTVVVALTLARTVGSIWSHTAGQIVRVLLREGLLYYSAICTITLLLTIMILAADQSVRNVAAQVELCLTVTMMSRITLHLKRFAFRADGTLDSAPAPPPTPAYAFAYPRTPPQTHRVRGGRAPHDSSFPLDTFATTTRSAAPIDLDVLHAPGVRGDAELEGA
ncbi:hypothetical protein BC834DRAFT_969965 [Gloeopeniophorella convolvens]|nr:hypothetical protein BC834DRAFT_969965 [Gloeopeniophorella convolvens]